MIYGINWLPIVSSSLTEKLEELVIYLDKTQWLSPDEIMKRQMTQFLSLLQHATYHSDYYRSQYKNVIDFKSCPILTRRILLEYGSKIMAHYPSVHGMPSKITTSGSTGQPVEVYRTELNQLIWFALTMRDHLWHKRDFSQTLCAVKANSSIHDDNEKAKEIGWGPPASLLYGTGPAYSLPLSADIDSQVKWLIKRNPGYLLTYPTNLAALLSNIKNNNIVIPNLKEIRTVGETVSQNLRDECQSMNLKLTDIYSSQEVGIIAIECPDSGLYHIQSENLIVEILREDGAQCLQGETGRVVVTDLHNFATPLIRYDIKDYATVGPECPCGRTLPTLSRILGRERNMVKLPDGTKHWPIIGLHHFYQVGTIKQYQFIQNDLYNIEMKLVVQGGKLDYDKEAWLTNIIQEALGYPFNISFKYFEKEIQAKNGKYEEFVSMLT